MLTPGFVNYTFLMGEVCRRVGGLTVSALVYGFNLTVRLPTQVYKWVLALLMLGVAL